MNRSLVLGNRLLSMLPSLEFERLYPFLETVDLVQDQTLVAAGEIQTKAYFPNAGIISHIVSLQDGQIVDVAMVGRDGVVGGAIAFNDDNSLTGSIVRLPGTASCVEVRHLRQVVEQSAEFRGCLIRHEHMLLAQVEQVAACNAAHSAEKRLARWLLRIRDLVDEGELRLTQEALAQMIGVKRNSISIVAHEWQEADIIRYSRGHLSIVNPEALATMSCECYQAVRALRPQAF